MTEVPRPAARHSRRSWLTGIVAALCAVVLLGTALLATYVARPESGLGRDALVAIEYQIGQDEELRYNMHRALGKLFSLCPCTAGLSADQYRRASFHRPRTDQSPRGRGQSRYRTVTTQNTP